MKRKRDPGHVVGVDPGDGMYCTPLRDPRPTAPFDPIEVDEETGVHCPYCDTWHAGEQMRLNGTVPEGNCEECADLIGAEVLTPCPKCKLAATPKHVMFYGMCSMCLWHRLFDSIRDLEALILDTPTTDSMKIGPVKQARMWLRTALENAEVLEKSWRTELRTR